MRVFASTRDGSSFEIALPADIELKRTLAGKYESLHGSVKLLENYISFWQETGFLTIWGTHHHVMFHAVDYIKVDDSLEQRQKQFSCSINQEVYCDRFTI